jgi:hypothetical protein
LSPFKPRPGFSSVVTFVTPEAVEVVSSEPPVHTNEGNFFCKACLYLGWLQESGQTGRKEITAIT